MELTVTPVPLLFLLLSALVLVPSYPYYVTFFYNALGIFLMLQAARENRDVYYMALLPLTKRDLVRARFSTIVTLQLLQALVCVPFMLLRRGYAEINNPVGIEANLAFLGFGFMLMGLFDLVFLPMHYKNGYDLGKPFVISSIVLFFAIVLLEALDHIVPYMKTVCESYASADLVRQLPVLLGGMAVYALEVWLAYRKSAAGSKRSICKPRYCAHGAVSNILLRQPVFCVSSCRLLFPGVRIVRTAGIFLISAADRLRKSCIFVKPAFFLHIVYKCFTNPAHKGAIISIIETKRK